MQRMRDQARFQEELDRRKQMEDELKSQASHHSPPPLEGDLAEQVDRLRKIEESQREEINRLARWMVCVCERKYVYHSYFRV